MSKPVFAGLKHRLQWMAPVDTFEKGLAAIASFGLAILVLSIVLAALLKWLLGGDLPAWVQTIGAIMAIISGFGVAYYQRREERDDAAAERRAAAHAAYILAYHALETVGERLDNILTPSGVTLSLEGDRTAEMVEAMREFETSRLPAEMLKNFILLRSHIFAINQRISEVYDKKIDTGADKHQSRHERLESTVTAHKRAMGIFEELSNFVGLEGPAARIQPTSFARITSYQAGKPTLV